MRLRTINLLEFKRFDNLTIDLGDDPKKVVAMVGPNGCGKSSVFDAFEEYLKRHRSYGVTEHASYFSKNFYYSDESKRTESYSRELAVKITTSGDSLTRKSFYIRTSYRYTSKLNVTKIERVPEILKLRDEPTSSISLDRRLQSNYERLLGSLFSEFEKGDRTGNEAKAELLGKINSVLNNIISVRISSLGNITLGKGQLYFSKGDVNDFPYENLSAGEKEVIDIIVDLVVKTQEYTETVFCIDEPELHLNTAIQRKLIIEIEKLIPEDCQLWIATHSVGFLRAIQDELSAKSQILDFSERDYFSGEQVLKPMVPNRNNWLRIFQTALDDLSHLISPDCIVYCEGLDKPGLGGRENGFDAKCYNLIFGATRPKTLFVSSGGNTELDQRSEIAIRILSKVFSELEILVLKDRDMASGKLVAASDRLHYLASQPSNHRVLIRWEIENYLFDKEVLKAYCLKNNLEFDEIGYDAHVTDIVNQDIKSSISYFKKFCGSAVPMNNDIFKINLASCITSEMVVCSELEGCIFSSIR